MQTIEFQDFQKVEIRVGTILEASILKKARKPAYKMVIDLGEIGTRQSSAQITHYYNPEELVGKQVVCVINFEPMKIAGWKSEVLVTGFSDGNDQVILAIPERKVPNGSKLY